ncbi:MAG: hypothetical protein M1357_01410 [Candidatus Marsarchaeota archaeon]|nr:hypothetical protein [Candidatus Marsarchaeota archaeon]
MTLPKGLRVLVTGAGGIAGVNFVRALRAASFNPYIVGTDFNRYYINFPDLDRRYLSPRHDDPSFVQRVASIVESERIAFVHPQPSSEASVLAGARGQIGAKTFLPRSEVFRVGQDKLATQQVLYSAGVPVAKSYSPKLADEVYNAFRELGSPLWVRARHGAGGRLSLLCATAEEALHWIKLWTLRGVPADEFVLQEYLPGRNMAWDSLWRKGKLVTSYCRERLEYPFKHISPSGITGTPSVARTIVDERVNEVSYKAVLAVDPEPDGAYSVDVKESSEGTPCITEVDAGKFHSTMPLWGYVAVKHMGLPWYANLADLYVTLGMDEDAGDPPKFNLLPESYYMIRNIDCGVLLWKEDGWQQRVL